MRITVVIGCCFAPVYREVRDWSIWIFVTREQIGQEAVVTRLYILIEAVLDVDLQVN
jgi:hypothetical protein